MFPPKVWGVCVFIYLLENRGKIKVGVFGAKKVFFLLLGRTEEWKRSFFVTEWLESWSPIFPPAEPPGCLSLVCPSPGNVLSLLSG